MSVRASHLRVVSADAAPDARATSTVPWPIVLHEDLSPLAKHVAQIIGGHMNGRLECYPSQHTMARIAGVTVRTIIRAVKALEATGWLEVERRSNGPVKESNKYRWRDPRTGKTGRVKAPAQMEAALLSLSTPERVTPVSCAGDIGDLGAGDMGVTLTTAFKNKNTADRSREERDCAPDGEFSFDWRSHLGHLGPPRLPDQLPLI